MNLSSIFHRLMGRKNLVQCYTNITYSTSEECLKLHGKIYQSEENAPGGKLDCPFHLLEFSVWKLSDYKEKGRKMRKKAKKEIERREIFQEAVQALSDSREEEARRLFEESASLDIFLDELEDLYDDFGGDLSEELCVDLKEIFVHAYKEKFAKERYERLPALMRREREEEGVKRIKELFTS